MLVHMRLNRMYSVRNLMQESKRPTEKPQVSDIKTRKVTKKFGVQIIFY